MVLDESRSFWVRLLLLVLLPVAALAASILLHRSVGLVMEILAILAILFSAVTVFHLRRQLNRRSQDLRQINQKLYAISEEATHQSRAMQILLEAGNWPANESAEQEAMSAICKAALEVMGSQAVASMIIQRHDGQLQVSGHCGFDQPGPDLRQWEGEKSFVWTVIRQEQISYVEDLLQQPELAVPTLSEGRRARSLLAAPLRLGDRIVGAVEIYSTEPRRWTEVEFKVIEWLAGQSALVLQSLQWRRQIQQRQRDAEEASRRKTRFLAAVSHDVRNPANAISLLAELIAQSSEKPDQIREIPNLAKDLRANAMALVALVSDVLDLARIDSGGLDMQISIFAADELMQEQVRQYQPLARDRGIGLRYPPVKNTFWLHTDRMKLARILANLISNAVKFTSSGSVEVSSHLHENGGADICVSDTGAGIAPEHQEDIFDEFCQLRNPERDRNKGTGLGLAICKRLAEAMGCRLSVQSQIGQGSTFTIEIPARLIVSPPEEKVHSLGTDPLANRKLNGIHVLLVEDHETTRNATARLLAGAGAIVLQAADGHSAMDMLEHEAPEVLLLDLVLPDIDGTDILRRLQRSRPRHLKCILAVSGDVQSDRMAEVMELGSDGMLAKPINIDQLIQIVQMRMGETTSFECHPERREGSMQ